jgi:dipicolinate synthase subunit B
MLLEGKKIGLALTGSFCTINRIVHEIDNIIKEGAEVFPILSESVYNCDTRFGEADKLKKRLESITGNKIISTIVEAEPIGPKNMFDLLVIAPCTGNTLAKLANAITYTAVTMAFKAQLRNQRPVLIAISTNDGLGANAKNLGLLLNMKNVYFIPFGQDDPEKKCNSLVAKFEKMIPSILEAINGRQIQPILV